MAIPPGRFGADVRARADALDKRVRAIVHLVGRDTLADARRRAPRREGGLSRSIRLTRHRSPLGFSISSRHPAARIQEFGGTIRPRTVSWLAVPLRDQTLWPRQVGRHRVVRDGSRVFLVDASGPAYELRQSVTVRAHPYMRPAVATARRRLSQLLRRTVGRLV